MKNAIAVQIRPDVALRPLRRGKVVAMARVSIVGGGNVGANAAFFIAEKGVTDVLLVDIQPGLSRGKMLDIMEAAPIRRYRNTLSGSDSLEDIKGSQLVVVAAGAIRAPGMRREDLFTPQRRAHPEPGAADRAPAPRRAPW